MSTLGYVAVALVCTAAGFGGAAIAGLNLDIVVPITLGVVALTWCVLRVRSLLHPAVLMATGLLAYGIIGVIVYPHVATDGPVPDLLSLQPSANRRALSAFCIASIGSSVAGIVFGRPASNFLGSQKLDIGLAPRAIRIALLSLCSLAVVLYVAGSSGGGLLRRTSYQGFDGTYVELLRVGLALSLPATFVAFFFVFSLSAPKSEKVWAAALVAAFSGLAVATASRELAIYPLIALVIFFLSRGRVPRPIPIIFSFVLSAASFSSAIVWRLGGQHGLFPYVEAFLAAPLQVSTSKLYTVIANVLVGFPVTGFILGPRSGTLNYDDLVFNLDPRPASEIGYDVANSGYTVVSYIPFNSVGMLFAVSPFLALLYFAAYSATVTFLWTLSDRLNQARSIIFPFLLAATALFFLISIQYPLRQSFRTGSILLALCLLGYFIIRFAEPRPAQPSYLRAPTATNRANEPLAKTSRSAGNREIQPGDVGESATEIVATGTTSATNSLR